MQNLYTAQKYCWFLKTWQEKPHTKEEIEAKWAKSSLNRNHTTSISNSSFYKLIDGLEQYFGATVQRNQDGAYYISGDYRNSLAFFREWMSEAVLVNQLIANHSALRSRIMLEINPSGTKFLHAILESMYHKQALHMRYSSAYLRPREMTFRPYALRLYLQRWYVVGESSNHPGEIRSYSLDRIVELSEMEETYTIPDDFDVEQYFRDIYGMMIGNADELTEVVIRVQQASVPYWRSLPIHESQQEINKTEQYSDFRFHLRPNFEFRQKLYSSIGDIEVLSPAYLREEMANTLRQAAERFSKP